MIAIRGLRVREGLNIFVGYREEEAHRETEDE